MRKLQIIKYAVLLILMSIILIPICLNFSIEDLDKPEMFEDEICSYNGKPEVIKLNGTKNTVNCTCYDEFFTDPNSNRFINGVKVQCSYAKKRRFIALFLSIFFPIGIDHFYLGNFYIFFLIFSGCWVMMIGNCIRFAVSPHENYLKNTTNLIFVILAILMIIVWVVNIVLISTGVLKDGNNVETMEDLHFLINIGN